MTPSQRTPEERRDIGALLAPDILEVLEENPSQIAAETEEMHPADLADVAEAMPFEQVPVFLAALPKERAAEVLEYLDEELRAEVLQAMTAQQAAASSSRFSSQRARDKRCCIRYGRPWPAASAIVQQLRSSSSDSSPCTMSLQVRRVSRRAKHDATCAIRSSSRPACASLSTLAAAAAG